MHGLVIKDAPLEAILAGEKTWEIRGSATTRRGLIGLIRSGSGTVTGVCELVGVRGPLSVEELAAHASNAGFRATRLPYARTHAWVLAGARRLLRPVPYRHPPGAVIWVRLADEVSEAVQAQLHTVPASFARGGRA
ncbi:MAG: ASCH domain-containing protein [Deltaproteobacteria bacterium]|nr:ASCH domain-containing protein [Deltaproteobacteria bacterium]